MGRARPIPRERLIGYLWPDHPADAARHLLSESLYVLRKEVAEGLFISTGDELALNRDIVGSDLEAFDDAVASGELQCAVELYHGPFLDGFYVADAAEFERWAEAERERVARAYGRALETLAEQREEAGDGAGAVELWRRIAAHDPYNARVVLRLMRTLEAMGERAAAIRQAEVHAALLRDEVGAAPDREVMALADRLRAERPPEPPASAADTGEGSSVSLQPRVIVQPAQPVATSPAAGEGAEPASPPAGADPPAPRPPAQPPARRSSAVWVADVVGYAHLRAHDPAGAERVLEVLGRVARQEVRANGGHVLELIGDAVLAEFPTADAALRASTRLLRRFERESRAEGVGSTLRAGIHYGEVATTPDGASYGSAVTAASRLQEEAPPGGIWVTGQVRALARPGGPYRFRPRGTRALDSGGARVEVLELRWQKRRDERDGRDGREPPIAAPPPRRRDRSPLYFLAALGIAAVVLFGVHRLSRRTAAQEPPLPFSSIAILYPDVLSQEDPKLEARGRALTERLIGWLAGVPELSVISRNGIKPYQESGIPLDSVARALRVGTIVGSSLERSGATIRWTVSLIDGRTGAVLESHTIEAQSVDESFALEDALAEQVSRYLQRRLGREITLRSRLDRTKNPRARRWLLEAEAARSQAEQLVDSGDTVYVEEGLYLYAYADTLLARAERADPRWVEPPTLRGSIALALASRNTGREVELLHQAIGHASRALRLRERDPAALAVRGIAAWELTNMPISPDSADALIVSAERDLGAAVEAEPQRADAWYALSQLRRFTGKFAESYHAARRALEADAYLLDEDIIHDRLYRSLLMMPRYDLARRHCDAGREKFPDDHLFLECRLVLLARDSASPPDLGAARALLDTLERLDPAETAVATGHLFTPIFREMLMAQVMARAGQTDSARTILRRAEAAVRGDANLEVSLAYEKAVLLTMLREFDLAVAAIEPHVTARDAHRRFIANDPAFVALRQHPRFRALTAPAR